MGAIRALSCAAVLFGVLACGPGERDYTAYTGAGGPRCGNNECMPGDLCKDPEHQNHAGLCTAVEH